MSEPVNEPSSGPSSGPSSDTDLSAVLDGAVGRITLRRARKLNALTHPMVRAMLDALRRWQHDERVKLILVEAEPGKAFCAGGDIGTMYRMGIDGDIDAVRRFFADEYRLNALIARYPKPYVAIMDGITMGGGIGISAHGSHRIVTERSVLAMPECMIGLVPDIGATHLLAQAPGHLGEYAGLSGARLGPGDALHMGLADHHVPSERLDALKAALTERADPAAIAPFAVPAGPSPFAERAGAIDALFGRATLADVLTGLRSDQPLWMDETHQAIGKASPLSLRMTFELIRQARRDPGVEPALMREYRFVARAIERGDFLEGVRAVLIDRDGAPGWRHAGVADVGEKLLQELQREAPGGDPLLDRVAG